MANHAGSWREFPVGRCIGRWRAGLLPPGKGLDHDHVATTAGARRPHIWRVIEGVVLSLRCDPQQPAGERDAVLAGGAGEQAIRGAAAEALRLDVEQEAASLRSVRVARWRAMIEPAHQRLSIAAQCRLLSISRSSYS